ncbi:hypothetical protein BCR33DRAFT_313632 [Rhizoclosmatium globosum]|uniref:Uncharacterized protein n=1 Tax=Rhizoclosmatium globosum TaxID=329046 RepID=A0A1Y2CZ12_9FUNG|nr:hypothetical protein BCR33DRAFT_313632 [Rhizoclosmatium globosum]|eukprot:ORY52282.1 hypothetical protein BCR33DRAFT_313632 [Rhizoclosmatium globosum]
MQALTVLLSLALAAPRLVSGQGQGGAATVTGTLGAATTTTQNGLGDSTTTTTTTLVNNGNSNSTGLTRTTSATASRTATTTISATTTAASNGGDGVQCVFLKGSQHCPSYAAYAIDANSLVLKQEAQGQTGVAAFDIMIENWASAGPRSIFSQATCSIWDPSQVRYADQFFCDYFVYDPFVYGDPTTPNAIKDCNLFLTGNSIESTSPSFNSRLYPRISNATCSAFYESMFDYISDCDGSTVSGRQSVKDTVSNACLVAVQAVQAGSPAIDMLKDTSSEALNCGASSSLLA